MFPMVSPILSLILLLSILPISSSTQSTINVWPKPTTISWPHPHSILISPFFTISSPKQKYLTSAVNRYRRQILTEKHQPHGPHVINPTFTPSLGTLTLTVHDLHAPLHHGVNESYTLTIPAGGRTEAVAKITAETPWGAMRGLETFSQLVWGNPPRIAAGVFVSDAPIFGHRGVLLDTSRNYYEVEDILRLIGAMSWNKMNVFHWHITDSHSFPIVLPSVPELAGKGSYGAEMEYSAEDVKRVVEFGLEHGVRVMPEIDMPGELKSPFLSHPV